jgi:hypothetical protein
MPLVLTNNGDVFGGTRPSLEALSRAPIPSSNLVENIVSPFGVDGIFGHHSPPCRHHCGRHTPPVLCDVQSEV